MNFEFVDEPPKRTSAGSRNYVDPARLELANACRAHPGEWLKVPTRYYAHLRSPGYFANEIKKGTSVAFQPSGAFAAKVREGIVFMMYKGTP